MLGLGTRLEVLIYRNYSFIEVKFVIVFVMLGPNKLYLLC